MTASVLLNLLINSTFSLLTGLVVVTFFIWLFRVPTGPWKLSLLTLPFFKIVYDFAMGVPLNSVLYSGVDPYSLPPKHQMLQIGAGFSNWAPFLDVRFGVRDLQGIEHAASIGDYLVFWLNRNYGSEVLNALLLTAAFVSVVLLMRRAYGLSLFEIQRRQDRQRAVSHLQFHEGFRSVDVYISDLFTGSPFTGGFLKPYICIPQDAFSLLEPLELEAVLAHERGHIRQFDFLATVTIQTLGDVFWFVPGYRLLSRRIDALREIVADQWAVQFGANPTLLAASMLKLQETSESQKHFVLYSAFFRRRSLLKTRIERLLAEPEISQARWGWNYFAVRAAFSVLIAIVMFKSTLGNNPTNSVHNAQWIDDLLKTLGLS